MSGVYYFDCQIDGGRQQEHSSDDPDNPCPICHIAALEADRNAWRESAETLGREVVVLQNLTTECKGFDCCPLASKLNHANERITALENKWVAAIGWAYADCCTTLDAGGDPRQTDMADVLRRATIDLGEGE